MAMVIVMVFVVVIVITSVGRPRALRLGKGPLRPRTPGVVGDPLRGPGRGAQRSALLDFVQARLREANILMFLVVLPSRSLSTSSLLSSLFYCVSSLLLLYITMLVFYVSSSSSLLPPLFSFIIIIVLFYHQHCF